MDDFLEDYGRIYQFLTRRSIVQTYRTQIRIE